MTHELNKPAAPLPAAPAPTEQAVELPRVIGISRDAESPGGKSVLVALDRAPTDDELRGLHDALAARQAPDTVRDAAWHVLKEDAKPDATRLFDVVIWNGVTLTGKHYTEIDWSAVVDWRYSIAAIAQEKAS